MSSLKEFHAKLMAADDRHTHTLNSRFSVVFRWETQPPKDQLGVNTANYMDPAFVSDFDYYIKRINVPNLKVSGRPISLDDMGENAASSVGYGQVLMNNGLVVPQEQTFDIEFYDTNKSIIDNFIEPWMRICVSPKAISEKYSNLSSSITYRTQKRFPTATIVVYMYSKDSEITSSEDQAVRKYVLTNCWPNIIDSPELNQDTSEYILRRVEFNFNKCYTERTNLYNL